MMTVRIVCVGDFKERYWRDAYREYEKRLSAYCKLETVILPESDPEKEKPLLLKEAQGYVIALCVEGGQCSSEAFAEKINRISMSSSKVTFLIGSSTGMAPEVKQAADLRLSFSEMTFPHQLMRVVLAEQIYRGFTILNHKTYHK